MLFDRLADLSLTVESVDLDLRERDTSSEFVRATTTVALDGEGTTGRGEDVTYDRDAQHEFVEAGPPDLSGEYTVAEFAEVVAEHDLFPTAPDRAEFRNYRRWAFESAALDLALRQADTNLASALDRAYDPVSFVVSTRLGEPPSTDRLKRLLEISPDLSFKLDPTPDWTADLAADVADAATVRILDLKGQYEGTDVDVPADPDLYQLVVDEFPDAVVEDPALTDETRAVLADHEDMVSWDHPITGIQSIEDRPFDPEWLNVKPSRFGSLESLLDTIEYCLERDVQLYGGGQFELGVGRGQIQALASLCYPDGPNDVAPAGYNDPEPPDELPASPLEPPADPVGFGW
ncbi:hypothetical protein ACFR9U_03185 [Halorientalis brevis]|uniref:Enolase n=1 Tax=Halorientalis brevis TaxID=1126241 RepID=A0ABD6C6S9_9EURY|nr:hypothetical protein [Halorientalis brevis]